MFTANSTAFVFSHPNHELAVYGLVKRLRPWLIYLTDGGGEDRVEQTREGLSRIGCLEKAVFLNHPEKEFYDRLLARDAGYFLAVADQVAEFLADKQVEFVGSDALEFYNPVHDLAIPITRAALAELSGWTHYEVPLVHQSPGAGTRPEYLVQRLPAELARRAMNIELSEAELTLKAQARDEVYTILAEQFGAALTEMPLSHLGLEVLGKAPAEGMREPGGNYVLRYEWRARRLLEEGVIADMITLDGHFRPVVKALMERAERGLAAAA